MLMFLVIVIGIVLLYLLFWPVPVRPAKWKPPSAPKLKGVYQSNQNLAKAELLATGGHGPEDVIVDSQGWLYAGLENGQIVRMQGDGSRLENIVSTGGRPLGLAFDADDNLLIADADKGLLSVNAQGEISVLVDRFEGRALKFTNHLDVAADGTVYFSESSDRFPLSDYVGDIIESRANGRLLAYDPDSGETRLVLDGVHFANGVAISPDQTFLLLAETSRYRLQRVWLSGPKAGQAEIFVDNLPGFPDNLHGNGQGLFWLALSSTRKSIVDNTAGRPFVRKILYRLPDAIQPKPERHGIVLALDSDGQVVHNLQDATGKVGITSGAVEHEGMVYVGSLEDEHIARVPVPS
ncbi:MAG: SMP-30/gluconolactonase/LRE family protein [Chloroflexota bacterium]|nr:MAG: SMP-30/gluconolactonase/LRE family protein [Chloroflexota bacterium]